MKYCGDKNTGRMDKQQLVLWLSETAVSSDESDSSEWSDVCTLKQDVSGDEDISDEEEDTLFFPLMQYLIRLRRKRVDDYLHIIDSWTDAEFKNRMRLSRNTAYRLIGKRKLILLRKIFVLVLLNVNTTARYNLFQMN